jgi:hypothetical protein
LNLKDNRMGIIMMNLVGIDGSLAASDGGQDIG